MIAQQKELDALRNALEATQVCTSSARPHTHQELKTSYTLVAQGLTLVA